MIIIETKVRLFPNILRNSNFKLDSFYQNNLLDYPQYKRPYIQKNLKVPEILLSGNHQKIKKWREKLAILNTYNMRPNLLKNKEILDKFYYSKIYKKTFKNKK